jgi:crotonobetainyl-CoA:carnitine CoA-transferase CaiB-like acyl-CoA transferase
MTEMNRRGPLFGVRVADFSVHAAGPFAGVMLAELGAEVIKIESAARLDITRRPHTMYGKPPSSFEQVNANKLSVTLNLKEPRAVELALELVSISDLVLENFRPGVMDRLGLGYTKLREVKPDIILVSLSANGQTGPESRYAGYAPMFAALGGLGHLTGYPDAPPVELRHAMDHTGGMMAALCAVAALCAKSRHTSKGQEGVSRLGQHVDVSVRDIATSFIGPALLDYATNQREALRQGNRDEAMSPHGVYRCRGDDAWVSIAIGSEAEWLGLVRALGNPAWAGDDTFGDAYQRWLHQDELDRHLEAWTAQLSPQEVTQRLQREGVAAFPSLSADQLMRDPHLLARDAFPAVEHPDKGRQRAVTPPWRFSETPARVGRWTPELGEHNIQVFHSLLGLSPEEVKALQAARVIW